MVSEFQVAVLLLDGKGGAPKDPAAAAAWFRRCAHAGDVRAQTQLAFMYAQGVGLARDPASAFQWWLRAASAGFAPAQLNLGIMYLRGVDIPPDAQQAARWLTRSAEQGNPQAQTNLALLYAKGAPGFVPNLTLAFRWMRTAAEGGFLCAEYNLGVLYWNGVGTSRNEYAAKEWFHRAASHRDSQGRTLDVAQICGLQPSAPNSMELADDAFSKN